MEPQAESKFIDPMPEVRKLLEEQLAEDSPAELRKQVVIAEAWQSRVSFQWRNNQAVLAQLKRQMLLPKSKEYTDMDRTVNLEASVSTQQATSDILKDYSEQLGRRISLGQSLLSSSKMEMKAGLTARSVNS